jgi:hypothetical protein
MADDFFAAVLRAADDQRHNFTDLVSGRSCQLVIPPDGHVYPGDGEAKIGIVHPGCPAVADLAVDLDAFYCEACKWNGRVSGAWCADLIEASPRWRLSQEQAEEFARLFIAAAWEAGANQARMEEEDGDA